MLETDNATVQRAEYSVKEAESPQKTIPRTFPGKSSVLQGRSSTSRQQRNRKMITSCPANPGLIRCLALHRKSS